MNQGIIIGTHYGNRQWLDNLLPTLQDVAVPVVIVINEAYKAPHDWLLALEEKYAVIPNYYNLYSPGVLQAAIDHTHFDEFLHLHDSCEVKDPALFDLVFRQYEGASVSLSHNFLMYIGKYRRETLEQVGIPRVTTKREEHAQEFEWNAKYIAAEPKLINPLLPEFGDSGVFEDKFGRKNMILDSPYIRKYKGTWDVSMIKD